MRRPALVLAVLAACVLLPSSAPAATPVSYRQLLRELRSGPVIRAIINRTRGDIEIKFRDLSEQESSYPRSAQPMLQALMHRRHIRVLFAARPHAARPRAAAAHHHLRYIAAAVLGALLIISAAAYAALRRRHSERATAGAAGRRGA